MADASKRTCSWSGCESEVGTPKGTYCGAHFGAKRRRKARLVARLEAELLDPTPPTKPDRDREKPWSKKEWEERLKARLAEAKSDE